MNDVKKLLVEQVEFYPRSLRAFHCDLKAIHGYFSLANVYKIAWELEKEGELVCLDYADDKQGDTLCFKGGTNIIQPGLRIFTPTEEKFVDALKNKGIMTKEHISFFSEDNFYLFVRTILEEFEISPPVDIKSEYEKILARFLNDRS